MARRKTTRRSGSSAAVTRYKNMAEAAQRRARSAGAKARENKSDITRKVTLAGAAWGWGKLSSNGMLNQIPSFGPVPRLLVGGVVAQFASMKTKGTVSNVLDGIGDAALAISAFQMGAGQQIAGETGALPSTQEMERELQRLENEFAVEGDHDYYDDDDGDDYGDISGDEVEIIEEVE